jgi:hypothetical protein
MGQDRLGLPNTTPAALREGALPHEKSAFGLFTKSPPLEVVSPSATRSPLGSCSFAQRTEVAIMRSLRQIFHEANGGVAVVLAERFRIRPFRWRQTWEQEHITFTWGRPSLKNDQCFVEQKNGAIVRQVVGYDLLVGEHSYWQLTELYRALRLYVNCFQPSLKLLSKQREGKKVRYVYDSAKTPLHRLLQSGTLPAQKQQELLDVAHALDPIRLFEQLKQLQQAVFCRAFGCSPFLS